MNKLERELFEKRLLSIARGMVYPRTPDIAGSVRARPRRGAWPDFKSRGFAIAPLRLLAWSLIVLLVTCSSLALIPPARAAIVEFIRIGIVRIFPPPVEAIPTQAPDHPGTATPLSGSSNLVPTLEQIAGKTTLLRAQQAADFPILLPSYPSDLGEPDYVFSQDAAGTMVILVWMDPHAPGRAFLSLHLIPQGSWAIEKMHPTVIERTSVNGQPAILTTGPYPLLSQSGDFEFVRVIDGHVLIWALDEITYRLETDLSVEEAHKIAESLQPMSVP